MSVRTCRKRSSVTLTCAPCTAWYRPGHIGALAPSRAGRRVRRAGRAARSSRVNMAVMNALPCLRHATAVLWHAPSIVCRKTGEGGRRAAGRAGAARARAHGMSSSHNSAAVHALAPTTPRRATCNHARKIVSCRSGAVGLLAPTRAELACSCASVLLRAARTAASLASTSATSRRARSSAALWTARSVTGAHGGPAR